MPPTPLTIRLARPEDAATIADFNSRMALETESKRLDPTVLRKGVEEVLRNAGHGVYYIAENEGTVVGQLMITYEWSDWRNGQFWWIQSVYVPEEWRGKGVFTGLYRHIMNLAGSTPGVCGVRLYVEEGNERAQRTYAKLGMTETGYRLFEVDLTAGHRP